MVKIANATPEGETLDPIDVLIGRRVCERRQEMRYTQAQLAGAIGVTFQQVQKYERGRNRISAARLWQIADFLNVDLDYFFDGLGLDEAEAVKPRRQATRQSAEISRLAATLSTRNQKLVLDLVHQLSLISTEAEADVSA